MSAACPFSARLLLHGTQTVARSVGRRRFEPQIREVLANLPKPHQTLLFSATMPAEIEGLARSYLNHPVTVRVSRPYLLFFLLPVNAIEATLTHSAKGSMALRSAGWVCHVAPCTSPRSRTLAWCHGALLSIKLPAIVPLWNHVASLNALRLCCFLSKIGNIAHAHR